MPNYLGGREVIERLIQATKTTSNQTLADFFELSKSTVGTWRHRDIVPFELVIRAHMETGVSIHWLTLGEGDPYPDEKNLINKKIELNQKDTISIPSYNLSNGKLIFSSHISYSQERIAGFNLEDAELIEVETIDGIHLIDKTQDDRVSGEYLIDMNGRLSISHIQRLPNNLAVTFGETTLEI